ncbi:MAG: hypothetical protein ACRENP_30465, partial [Longimicrobiales bacterium]
DVQSNGPELRATGRSWAKELGLDARARARRAAERALELDSLHAGAAAIYGEIALQLLEDEELQRARTTLQRAVTATSDPAASLVLARVLAQFNDPVGAIAASERATRAEPDNPFALHAHALALFRYPGKEAEGARQYFAAVERASPGFAERLFEELRPLATPADTVRFSRAALDQRKVLMRDFWNVRAALGGVTVAERLAEHYRRLAVALDFYPRLRGGPARQENVVWEAMTLPIDARGQLYVRHGAPWKISVTPSIGRNSAACRELTTWTGRSRLGATTLGGASGTRLGMPAAEKAGPRAEVWAYQTEAGMRAFALVRCLDAPDYYLPYTIPCGLEFPPEFEVQSFDIHSCDADTRERMRDWARSALSTETHSPNISRRIPLNFDLLSFRGRAGTTDLLAPIALLSDSILSTRTATGQLRYTLALQLAVIDTARQTVTHSADTISFLLAEPLAKGDRLSRHALVRAAPTDHAFLRLVVRNLEHDNNGATRTELIRVPAYAGDTLMVSDLVLGGD